MSSDLLLLFRCCCCCYYYIFISIANQCKQRWCVWHPATTTAVCIKCRCSAGVLGPKVRTHHSATPWTPLAESSGEDKVSALCSGFLMPSYYSATVSCRDLATDNELQFPPPPAICRHVDTDRSSYTTTDPWRLCVSSCGCPCLELSAVLCQRCTVTGNLSTAAEDRTIQDILRRGCWYLSRVTLNMWLFCVC